jgi:phosphoethanolamine N-methyltransferase
MKQMSDNNASQYSLKGILRYEWIFGKNFLAPGEPESSELLCSRIEPRPGLRVLDVGSGIGGPAFMISEKTGATVTGIDYTKEIYEISEERLKDSGLAGKVDFMHGDITQMDWEEGSFDVIWSRDTLLHIPDKLELFKKFYHWLSPNGQVLLTDYARSAETGSREFEDYVQESGYDLHDLESYAKILEKAGFVDVVAEDQTDRFIKILENDIANLQNNREAFCEQFDKKDCDYLEERWKLKLKSAKNGYMKWGWFMARRPA